MAKKRGRFTGENIEGKDDMSKEELQELSKGVVNPTKKKKKEPSVPYSIRIPRKIYDRLEEAEDETGMKKTGIIINGIVSELNRLKDK